ncbi:MAG: hypothetical protein R3F39_20445 [Myxococcota bacterium]
MRPYQAALLRDGVILDEAHLVPPFEALMEAITSSGDAFWPRDVARRAVIPRSGLLALSATGGGGQQVLTMVPADRDHRNDAAPAG